MSRPSLPLNALRAFEAAARHQNFTRAALELYISQAALSHQIRSLEQRLGVRLFHRLPRGVTLTEEGAALYPVLNEAFDRIAPGVGRFLGGKDREVLTLGVVGTFATGWLLPRLAAFEAAHPDIELRVQTHNNRIDLTGEGLTQRSASAMATGRARSARRSSTRLSRRCARRPWSIRCGNRATSPGSRCCVPTVPTNGPAGSGRPGPRAWKRAGRSAIPR